MQIWQAYLKNHFSHSCYQGKTFTEEEMLNNYLATIQYAVKDGDGSVKFTQHDEVICLETKSEDTETLFFPVSHLNTLGFIRKPKQSAKDFLDEYWDMY